MKVGVIKNLPEGVTQVHVVVGAEEEVLGAILGKGNPPSVLRMWRRFNDEDSYDVFNADRSGRAGRFYLRTVYYDSPHGCYPVDLLVQVCEGEVISVEEITGIGPREVVGTMRRVVYKKLAAQSLKVGVCFTRAEREAISTWEDEKALDVKRLAEDASALEAIAHPRIGNVADANVLLGLLRTFGPASAKEAESESVESGHRPTKGGVTATAKGRDGAGNKLRGNKHAGKGRGSHRPRFDDERPDGASLH
ncbi:MAG: hypothetical protein KBD21_03980 [Candidatus Pacebacteria bacterium]|nr:hypothetical protein [Candidatus Paceibacterota bacterium]